VITPEARAKAAHAKAEMVTKRTTFKGCSGTLLKVGDRVAVSDDKYYRRPGPVTDINRQRLGDHAYTEVGVRFGEGRSAWFRDDELTPLSGPSVNA
jgi:hypothetical protein